MKIRAGFVTNSSSSSFIIIVRDDITADAKDVLERLLEVERGDTEVAESISLDAAQLAEQYWVDVDDVDLDKCSMFLKEISYCDDVVRNSLRHLTDLSPSVKIYDAN